MGANLDQFRAKKISAEVFLVNALWLALDKPNLPDTQAAEWETEARRIKGDPEEVASAIEWALRVHPKWPRYLRRMKNVADNLDSLLRDYRAEMRAERNARAANGSGISDSCQKWMDTFPGMTRAGVNDKAAKFIVAREVTKFKKTCKECKGKEFVPSKDKVTKGTPVPCSACQAYKISIFDRIWKKIHDELYA